MGGRRRCCCGCWSESDDFDRANTEPVTGWTEITGDSDIVANELSVPAGGLILFDTPHPKNSRTCWVFVDLIDAQDGDSWEVRVGCDINGDNGDVVRVLVGASDITFWVNGGNANTLVGYTPGEDNTLQICRNIEGIYATLKTSAAVWVCSTADTRTIPRYVALANFGSTAVTFDNFSYVEHHHTNATCNACGCACGDYCISPTLTVTFSATGDCSPLDGLTVTLNYTEFGVAPCVWTGSASHDDCDGGTKSWDFTLHHLGGCGSGGFVLCYNTYEGAIDNFWDLDGGCGGSTYGSAVDACVCEPLVLEFGSFRRSHSGGLLGDYDLTVTE